jgi:hypothetical protein
VCKLLRLKEKCFLQNTVRQWSQFKKWQEQSEKNSYSSSLARRGIASNHIKYTKKQSQPQVFRIGFKVAKAMLEKKKRDLLAKYVSDDLLEEEMEAKKLAGKI